MTNKQNNSSSKFAFSLCNDFRCLDLWHYFYNRLHNQISSYLQSVIINLNEGIHNSTYNHNIMNFLNSWFRLGTMTSTPVARTIGHRIWHLPGRIILNCCFIIVLMSISYEMPSYGQQDNSPVYASGNSKPATAVEDSPATKKKPGNTPSPKLWELKDQIALGSALVALLSLVITGNFLWLNFRREKLNQKMQYATLKQQYFSSLRAWADKLSDVISEAIHLCDLDPKKCPPNQFFETRHRLCITISSMIDQGRWFFPNLNSGERKERESVLPEEVHYSGYRQEVLNSLVSVYGFVRQIDFYEKINNASKKDGLVKAKKKFVSEIQEVLNPARRDSEFKEITHYLTGKM